MKNKKKILVVYSNAFYPLRSTLYEHLFCFKKYSSDNCFYFNADTGKIPRYLTDISFDLIIFPTLFLSSRWNGRVHFQKNLLQNIEALKKMNAVKIAIPQDEWIFTNMLNEFITDFGIDIVFTVAPRSELKKIYNNVDHAKVKFIPVLTGYLDESLLKRIERIVKKQAERKLDICYRAAASPEWLGSFGFLKTELAPVFNSFCKKEKLRADISVEYKNTFYGDDWFRFLAGSNFTIGVEGGSGIIDPEGEIRKAGMEYKQKYPEADFAAVEQNCFPGMNGNLELRALSPRHLEACATFTCQILIEGDYNNVLEKNVHYIPLKKDLSDLQEVSEAIKNKELRKKMTEAAYKDIIASGKYTYRSFVKKVTEISLEEQKNNSQKNNSVSLFIKLRYNRFIDKYHDLKITRRHPAVLIPTRILVFLGFRKLRSLLSGRSVPAN